MVIRNNNFEVCGMNLDLTDALKDYVERKVNKAIKHTEGLVSSVRVNLLYEAKTDSHVAEIIVFLKGNRTVRNYSKTDDMYASIDIATASIERQLRKTKEKIIDVKRYRTDKESFISSLDQEMQIAM